jgi:acyl-CoA thioesterase-1
MRKFLTLLLLLWAAHAPGADAPAVLVFGDSLSAGYGMDVDQSWPSLLQERFRREEYEYRVINASISGETTEGGAQRIEGALRQFAPLLVIVELGGNDGLRGFPPQRMQKNLETIISKSREAGAEVVLLGIRIPSNYGARYTEAFERVYRDLAEKHDLPWIEFFMQGIASNRKLMQDDGIHPNAAAQSILLDNAWPVIAQALEAPPAGRSRSARETG